MTTTLTIHALDIIDGGWACDCGRTFTITPGNTDLHIAQCVENAARLHVARAR